MAFIKEVAKYFMDFLETDFHKRKNPKRSVQFRSRINLVIGLNLNKYPSFNNLVWKGINHTFDKNVINTVQKGVYKTSIPKNLIDLIKLQSEKILKKQIENLLKQIVEESIRESGATGASDLGKVMKVLMPKVKGKADGKLVNQIVREKLGA